MLFFLHLHFYIAAAESVHKIEPWLVEKAATGSDLDVVIFIQQSGVEDVTIQVKKRFASQIKALSGEIRLINRKYRPDSADVSRQSKGTVSQILRINETDKKRLSAIHQDLDTALGEKKKAIGEALKDAVLPNLEEVTDFVQDNGGTIRAKVYLVSALGATIPAHFLETLADHPLVYSIRNDPEAKLSLDVSAPASGFDTPWNGGNTGGIYEVGIVDSGVQEDHPAFSGITFITDSEIHTDTGTTGHGTHVTGIFASIDPSYRGCAYGVEKVVWSLAEANETEHITRLVWQAELGSDAPEVMNHSIGYEVVELGDPDYYDNDRFYDAFVYSYDILISQAAGNNGTTGLDRPGNAYNVITVANMDDQDTLTRTDDRISATPAYIPTSSPGPTPGDRKKPDITAPGTDIISCNYQWDNWWTDDFVSKTGTSMAVPHVTAAILLLQDGGIDDAKAQKAVLINTADAWSNAGTTDVRDDGPVSGSHWDNWYGWGYLNMDRAYLHRSDYFTDNVVANNGTATDDDYKLYKGFMSSNEKATLVWHKRVNPNGDSFPPSGNAFDLSNLDIILFDENDNSIKDADSDDNDNVHQISSSTAVNAVIKVYAEGGPFDGIVNEWFAIATMEDFMQADPPAFDIDISFPAEVQKNTDFTVTATVSNTGDVAAHSNSITLVLPAGFSIRSGSNPRSVAKISAKSSEEVSWTVQAGASVADGLHELSAQNGSSCYYEIYIGETDPLEDNFITVTSTPGPSALSNDTPETFFDVNKVFTFRVESWDWCAVAINPDPSDHDIRMDDDPDPSDAPIVFSDYAGTTRDFVVVNGHALVPNIHYAQVYWSTSSDYIIEAEWDAVDLLVGVPFTDNIGAGEVIQVYEVDLPSKDDYQVTVDITSGTANLSLYIFRSSRSYGSRESGQYEWVSNSAGSGGDESISFDTGNFIGPYGILVVNENGNSADYTITVVEVDMDSPSPDPMTWTGEPAETGISAIAMVATPASDDTPPVSYLFEYMGSPTGGTGGTSSVWQEGISYLDTGLQTNHQYGYQVEAMDNSPDNHTTSPSTPVSYEYTDIEAPVGMTVGTVTSTSISLKAAGSFSGLIRANSGIKISNTTQGTDSGWKQNNDFWTSSSLTPNTPYQFTANSKNGDGNEANGSASATLYSDANAPGTSGFTNVGQSSIRANWTASGNPAGTQYYCENLTRGTNSGWTTNTYWTSSSLACGNSFQFRVRAKNGDGLETATTSLGTQSTSDCPDASAPTPDPMIWSEPPYETSTTAIAMTAATASDPSGPVSYFFDYVYSPTGGSGGNDSSWQAGSSYTDSGLSPNHQYGYRARARDANDNRTGYTSPTNYDYTDIETPAGISFGTITAFSIQARSADTPSGLTRGSSGLRVDNVTNGTDSGWKQNNSYWTSSSLSANSRYGFMARARNGDGSQTGLCGTAHRHTLANIPSSSGFSNFGLVSLRANWTANQNSAGTEYYCENTTKGSNSGWITSTYWDSTGLSCGSGYGFRVRARNGDGTVTGWRSLGSASTPACDSPCPNCSGVTMTLTDAVFPSHSISECICTQWLVLGSGVTVESNAEVLFRAPTVTLKNGFSAEEGSKVTVDQQ